MINKENEFIISGAACNELIGRKVGERVQALISYQAVEKTKSYMMIRIKYMTVFLSKRRF